LVPTALVLLAGLVLAYANHFHNGFYFDDHHTIVSNAAIRDLRNLPRFFTDAATFSSLPTNQSYRPLVTTLNAIDYHLGGGLDPFVFHLHIFAAYVLQLGLMVVYFRRLMARSLDHPLVPWIALLSVAFYGYHTANAETINYIISRSDSFSTLLVVATLLIQRTRIGRRWHLYLLTMLMAIETKQTGLMVVPLLFLQELLFGGLVGDSGVATVDAGVGHRLARAIRATVPAAVVGALVFLTNQLLLTPASTVSSNATVSRLDYLLTQSYVVTHYLRNFALPLELNADPGIRLITDPGDPRVLVGIGTVVVLVVIALVTAVRQRMRPIGFGILWFFVALAPTSSLVPLHQIANDHRTFFPYVGLALAVGWTSGLLVVGAVPALRRSTAARTALALAIVAVLAAHALGVRQRNQVWSSGESLWRDVTIKSPDNARGLMNYGLARMRQGHYEEALELYRRAMELSPRYSYLHINMAIVLNAMGDPGEAERYFKSALELAPDNPESYVYYARWLCDRYRLVEAQRLVEDGLRISPGHTRLRELEAALERDLVGGGAVPADSADGAGAAGAPRAAGAPKAAGDEDGGAGPGPTGGPPPVTALEARVRTAPSADGWIELSVAYYRDGRYRDSIDACHHALVLRPDDPLAYNNLCSAYNRLGDWDAAIAACERALALAPDFARARGNLRWALDGRAEER
jgi:tetratricopeptide (TPR) repeat protein